MSIILELGKYVVPYLHVTVTVAAYGTAWFATAIFLTAVIVNLRTRTARTCAMLPEVILFAKPEKDRSAGIPISLFQISNASSSSKVNRRIQTILIQSDHLGQELPGPVESLRL